MEAVRAEELACGAACRAAVCREDSLPVCNRPRAARVARCLLKAAAPAVFDPHRAVLVVFNHRKAAAPAVFAPLALEAVLFRAAQEAGSSLPACSRAATP